MFTKLLFPVSPHANPSGVLRVRVFLSLVGLAVTASMVRWLIYAGRVLRPTTATNNHPAAKPAKIQQTEDITERTRFSHATETGGDFMRHYQLGRRP